MSRPDELEALRRRVQRLEDQLQAARTHADQWRQVAEERRVVLERMRQNPAIRGLVALRSRLAPARPAMNRMLAGLRTLADGARRVVGMLRALQRQQGIRRRRTRFQRRLRQLDQRPHGRVSLTASIVIVTRDGGPDLDHLLRILDETLAVVEGQVIVVDNGNGQVADTLQGWVGPDHELVRMAAPSSFSAANNAGAAVARCDAVCFLNDDVVPSNRDWFVELLRPLEETDAVAVGAQLLYAPQPTRNRRFGDLSVQHLGVHLCWRGVEVPRPANVTRPEIVEIEDPFDVLAVTGACLVVNRRHFEAVGGFDEGYDFGAEDVDLCVRLRQRGQVVIAPAAVLLHYEGATRGQDNARAREVRQQRNWRRFEERHGSQVWHEAARDRVMGNLRLADRPIRVAITVTRDDPALLYGDLVTARRLGSALAGLGYEVEYVERYRDAWYELSPDVDVLVVLLDTFDVRRVQRPGLLVVAWIRNWESRWTAHPWAGSFDLVLASSDVRSLDEAFRSWGVPVSPMPLATPAVEGAHSHAEVHRSGVVAPVNNWGDDRGLPALVAALPELEVFGSGWNRTPELGAAWKGILPPAQITNLYRRCEIVVDLSALHTADGGSVNTRVFEALAHGAIVVSNQPGVRRLFGDDVPVFTSANELKELVDRHRADPGPLREAAARARQTVEDSHTWAHRGLEFRRHLRALVDRPRIAFLTGAPEGEAGRTWGDTHLAKAFAVAMRRRGMAADVVARPSWESSSTRAADVTVHLKGRGRAPVAGSQVNVLWIISHPEEVADDELDSVDLVLAGSRGLAEHLRLRTTTPVSVLRQATDDRRFRPAPPRPELRTPLVFVGNSRFVQRPLVRAAVDAGLDVVVHGDNWERFLPDHVLGNTWIPNADVPAVYCSADIVLNDHWDIMRRWGLVSNRIFDALACGACVVSDDVPELSELFEGNVVTVKDPGQLASTVHQLLGDEARRRSLGEEGRRLVLARHTFDHRASELEDVLQPWLHDDDVADRTVARRTDTRADVSQA